MKTTIDKIITVASGLSIKSNKINTDLSNIILTLSELIAVGGKLDNILNLFNNTIPDSGLSNGSSGSNTGSQSDLVALGILPKQISEFTTDDIGTIISIPYTDESGKISLNNGCIEFKVVGVNHHKDINDLSKPTITLMPTNILRRAAFDAKEPDNPDYVGMYDEHMRAYGGNNRWGVSNIRQWLNSENAANEWFTPQHEYDTEPNSSNVGIDSTGAYSNDAGFLAGFSSDIKQHLATIKNITYLCNTDRNLLSKDFLETEDKVFLPSITEVNGWGSYTEGTKLEIIKDPYTSIRYDNNYWLRSYYHDYLYGSCSVAAMTDAGETIPNDAYYGGTGITPLIVLC